MVPLSTLFQLYRGCKFYCWMKPEYPETVICVGMLQYLNNNHFQIVIWTVICVGMLQYLNNNRFQIVIWTVICVGMLQYLNNNRFQIVIWNTVAFLHKSQSK
jgi:hypothetical protein